MGLTEQPEKPNPEEDTSMAVDMLTPEEIEQLRQDKKETHAYCQKAFSHLRPNPAYSAQPTKEEFDAQIQTEENPEWNGAETKPCPPTYVTSPQKFS